MQDISSLVCNQPGCPLASTGDCLEGFDDPHRCPHASSAASQPKVGADEVADDGDDQPVTVNDWLQLASYTLLRE